MFTEKRKKYSYREGVVSSTHSSVFGRGSRLYGLKTFYCSIIHSFVIDVHSIDDNDCFHSKVVTMPTLINVTVLDESLQDTTLDASRDLLDKSFGSDNGRLYHDESNKENTNQMENMFMDDKTVGDSLSEVAQTLTKEKEWMETQKLQSCRSYSESAQTIHGHVEIDKITDNIRLHDKSKLSTYTSMLTDVKRNNNTAQNTNMTEDKSRIQGSSLFDADCSVVHQQSTDADKTTLYDPNINELILPSALVNGSALQSTHFLNDESVEVISFHRTIGNNEILFKEKYAAFVAKRIDDFENKYPGQLKSFSLMTETQKIDELKIIKKLLARLSVSNSQRMEEPHQFQQLSKPSQCQLSPAKAYLHKGDDSHTQATEHHAIESNMCCDSGDSTTMTHDHETSMRSTSFALLSPDNLSHKKERSLNINVRTGIRENQTMSLGSTPTKQVSDPALTSRHDSPDFPLPDDNNSTVSSVEIVRRSTRESSFSPRAYTSPDSSTRPNTQKRLATTSGKKGMDLSRLRIEDSVDDGSFASEPRPSEVILSPSQLDCSGLPSPDNAPLFSASQSPIHHHGTFSSSGSYSSREEDSETDSDEGRRMDLNDTVETFDLTLVQNHKRRIRWKGDGGSYLQEIPANIKLREGASFHFQPLKVGRPRHRPRTNCGGHQTSQLSFSDPLDSYRGLLGQKMNAVFDEIFKREECGNANAIIFSLSKAQIYSVTLKVLLESHDIAKHISKEGNDKDVINGGTLIVARSRDCLGEWEKALRVGTFHSVLNHSAIPLSERSRTAVSKKCANYDVVLTTFDGILSKDTIVAVNSKGHVVPGNVGFQDGWYAASRKSETNNPKYQNVQLSVLHLITWTRVIFVDYLGRKSYIAKGKNLRGRAAIALISKRRWVFFESTEVLSNPIGVLRKSDRTAVHSVSAVLHLPLDKTEQCVVDDCCIDLNTVL